MTILIKAGTGLLAGVIAGALGLAFLPRMQPSGLTPRAAVGRPQFVAAVSSEAGDVARSSTTVAVPLAPAPAKPAPAVEAKAAIAPTPEANPPAAPVVLTKLEPPKPISTSPHAPTPLTAVAVTRAVAEPVAPAQAPSLAPANESSARWSVQGLVALAKGDLASARLYLTRAAEAGDPRAWVALADTYDPAMLTKLGVVGAPGDPRRAKDYLQKAADAGLVVAKNRMAALDPGGSSVR